MSVSGWSPTIASICGRRPRGRASPRAVARRRTSLTDRRSGVLDDADRRVGGGADLLDLPPWAGTLRDRGPVGLVGGLPVNGLRLVGGRLGEEVVEAACQGTFEAAQRSLGGFPFGFLAREVRLRLGVVTGAGDRDDVQRVVELAVPAAVQSVLGTLP